MATAIPYWIDDPDAWNHPTIGDVRLPGVCTVVAEKGREIDVKKTKGKDGVTETDNGMEAGTVKIAMQIGNARQWAEWQAVRSKLDPNNPGALKSPMEIQHPACSEAGIRAIVIKKISSTSPTAKAGRTYTFDCVEWFPQPPKKTKASKTVKHVTYSNADPLAAARAANPFAFMPTGADAIDAAFKKP